MLGLILVFALLTRLFNISSPPVYYFDEVYNAFTTLEFVKGNPQAYEWFHTSPVPGTAYGWTHPPLAKLLGTLGILAVGPNAFGWRIINVLIGVGCVYLVYLIAKRLLKSEPYALLAAAFTSLDGLLLTSSRINMNDIVATFFILVVFLAFIVYQQATHSRLQKRNMLILGVCLGLLLATKWTGLYAVGVFGAWIGLQNLTRVKNWPAIFISFICIPVIIYILSYSQYFLLGGTWKNFLELQNQMWWYNTNLKATHTYQSAWWTWPLMLRPVWYFVDYQSTSIANIYGMGNPILWWLGIPALLYTFYSAFKKRSWQLWVIVAGFLTFWLPWARAPRIMFLYHYLPSIPFLCIALAHTLSEIPAHHRKSLTVLTCSLIFISFVYFYPLWTGIQLPKAWVDQYFWLTSWR